MKTILVQMADESWTMQALHLACALASNQSANIVLLRLMAVPHPSYLGTAFGQVPLTNRECDELVECAATAAEYGVEVTVRAMQCVSALDAVADAAQQLDAHWVFACIPKSWLPFWHNFQVWSLRRRLAGAHRQLFTLGGAPQDEVYVPAITIETIHSAVSK
jgi:hypothetical protein